MFLKLVIILQSTHFGLNKFLTFCKILMNICLIVTGDNSGKVVIWNMAPVKSEVAEKNDNVPKMLCQMDNHFGGYCGKTDIVQFSGL